MVKAAEVLAVIPARGGSKGLPRKNIRPFLGHPLIAFSIAAGLQAETVTRTLVTTDDEEIAAVSRQYGAETPFLRPPELARDETTDLPVFQHVLNWLSRHEGYQPDIVLQLRPTSPLRPPTLLDDAVRLLLANPEADSVRAVVPSGQNPYKMWKIDPDSGKMMPLLQVDGLREPYNSPRQILPKTFWQIGVIDAVRPRVIVEDGLMSGDVILPIVLDERYAVDIDTLESLQQAEWRLQTSKLDMVHPSLIRRPLPDEIDLVVFDFDGVMTDNRVWVDADGHEFVAAYRSDSMGINRLRAHGTAVMVLSTEINKVVEARCRKLNLPVIQGVEDKASVLQKYLAEHGYHAANVVFAGNDINDVPCFPLVGCAVVVADAQTEALQQADIVLTKDGGYGAVRELCDMILATRV